MKRIVITGGAGFVGGNLALFLKEALGDCQIVVLDNLMRRGSEFQLERLASHGIAFRHGDVRQMEDLLPLLPFDFLVECSAEPSVQAGTSGSPDYLVRTNLQGATNCAELCRRAGAGLIFLSSSRVYPFEPLNQIAYTEGSERYELASSQPFPGLSALGVAEDFPLTGLRSLYGATKYAAELIMAEYRYLYGFPVVINRCGVIAGPWQFGRVDQGIVAYWLRAHLFRRPLTYLGFGGQGLQVRDILHVEDLARLVLAQIRTPDPFDGGVYNVGGGRRVSVSLVELTRACRELSGNHLDIGADPTTRYADIPIYLSDTTRVHSICGWQPEKTVADILADTWRWLRETEQMQVLLQ